MTLRLRIIGTINEKISWDTLPKGTFLTFWRLQKVKWSFPFLTLSQQRCAAVQATTEAKNVGNFPVILVKLHCSELPPSTPNNIEFWVKRLEMSPFGGTTLLGGGGEWRMKGWSQSRSNYRYGADSYVTITYIGFSIVPVTLVFCPCKYV